MKIINYALVLFLFAGCGKKLDNNKLEESADKYEWTEWHGIYFEKFDSTNTNEDRFNTNNQIYRTGTKLTYVYQYIDKGGKRFLFTDDGNGTREHGLWKLVEISKADSNSFEFVRTTVKNGTIPNFYQTLIDYDIIRKNNSLAYHAGTGIVENEKNVWIHPPRMMNFKILELNPFPYIRKPYAIGDSWTWELEIGGQWGDKSWRTWSGDISNIYKYEITETLKLNSRLGILDCFVIESKANSELGKTSLTAYFNEIYGFVKLDYTNIDSSKIVLELANYEVELAKPYNFFNGNARN